MIYHHKMFNLKWILMGFLTITSGAMMGLPYILSFIGLSNIGPIAGGLFSSFQGAGIVSGSIMAMTQSFAMSGWVIVIQISTFIFWVIVSIFNFSDSIKNGKRAIFYS